ncbi:MAG: hypothetical protein ACKV2Q_05810 [Planctomycetaceae bacterium]
MLQLPALTIRIPEGEGPIHDIDLGVTVEGGPEGVALYIQDAYSAAVSRLKSTLRETTAIEPRPTGKWNGVDGFKHQQPVVLKFSMTFSLSDQQGKPTGERRRVEHQVAMHPDEVLHAPFTVSVNPPLIRAFDSKANGPELEIKVRAIRNGDSKAATDETPKLRMNSPDLERRMREWGMPNLRPRIEEMLNKVISRRSRDNNGGWVAREIPRLDLTDDERTRLIRHRAKDGKPLRFSIRMSIDGSTATQLTIELLPHENPFAGVVGFDLGTHGSTIVTHDPGEIDNPAVPREQVVSLQKQLGRWIKRPSANPFPEMTESQWFDMLKSVAAAMNLDSNNALAGIEGIIEKAHQSLSKQELLFELLRQFEVAVFQIQGRARRDVQESLADLLQSVFEEFPLKMWNLRAVEFSDGEVTYSHTSSELELTDMTPEVCGEIGFQSASRHQNWLRSGEQDPAGAVTGNIRKGRFIRNPKASLDRIHLRNAEDYQVVLKDGSEVAVSPSDVVSAAYGSLLRAFEVFRTTYGLSGGTLDRAVITYPASLLPEPRERIVALLKQHGVRHVDRTFDEAVAPALFYMEQRFSDAPEIGPEAFKIRCRRIGDIWHHQMLIVDVGAGTTDIALIQIQMRETRSSVDPENGGRIYTISPRLLGSTGRDRLGGNLITLLLFRRLKLLLADWLRKLRVAAAKDESIDSGKDNGDWRSDSAIAEVDFRRNDTPLRKLLDEVEGVIATRFKIRPDGQPEIDPKRKALKTSRFFAIWEIAEAIKIEFSRILGEETRPETLSLESLIKSRLKQIVAGTEFERMSLDAIDHYPEFRTEDFSTLARSVVEQATQLAYALTNESLNRLNRRDTSKTGENPGYTLDSIVLSGRSSQLPIFRESLEACVRRGAPFGSNRTEILYHNKYAKLATAIGAVRGQRLVSLAPTEPNTEEITAGLCFRDLDIKNLFFFLPSSFKFGTQEGPVGKTIFEMHEQFRHHDFTPIGRLRTGWDVTSSDETLIYRMDGEDQLSTARLWGQMILKEIAATVGVTFDELKDGLQVRFEITHELDLYAMLRRSGAEHRRMVYASRDASTPPECHVKVPENVWKKLVGNNADAEKLPFQIFVGEPKNNDAKPLIDRGTPFSVVCNVGTEKSPDLQPALWSTESLPPIKVREKAYNLYARDSKSGAAILLAHFNLDSLSSNESPKFSFEARYRVMVATDGTLALICGDEPPFWTTTDPVEWFRNDRQVLRYKLPRHQAVEDFWNDPFCGHH